ncbi:uncharacterized protein BDV14DRAFT_174480 [Aspergillus stella-maris]|uniref:uncharacterized protein n=1 Tax=Aspergillus stella-maris TaxID=1810926 RepID=UPI003CCDFFDE
MGTARCVTITQVPRGTGPFLFLLSYCLTGRARWPIKSCMLIWPVAAAGPLVCERSARFVLVSHVPLLTSYERHR